MKPAAALRHIDAHLRTLATTPEAYGQSAETPLFTALSLLEARAALTGAPNPRVAYENLLREQWGSTSYHASHYLGPGRIGAFLTALLDRTLGTSDPPAVQGPQDAPGTSDVQTEPEPDDTRQGGFPWHEEGKAPPSRTRHTFGALELRDVPAPLGEAHAKGLLQSCRNCGCLRRFANTGERMGSRLEWSLTGEVWNGRPPPCFTKGDRR